MARIDIVVFPNGGREIFGQVNNGASAEAISKAIKDFLKTLESAKSPRQFTGYYDTTDVSDIEWQPYDENNPIVQVPVEVEKDPSLPDDMAFLQPEFEYVPMELASVPENLSYII